jgi:hypothetical protein
MDMQAMPQSGMSGMPPSGMEEETSKYTIEITALQDGSFTVQLETGTAEEGEESGQTGMPGEQEGATEDQGAQPAASFSEAMDMANTLYQSQEGNDQQSVRDQIGKEVFGAPNPAPVSGPGMLARKPGMGGNGTGGKY